MHNLKNSATLPAVGDGKRGAKGHLGYLLRQANVAVRGCIERDLAELEVTHPQFVVLTMIAAYPGLSNADLARLSLLTPQTVSVIVSNLRGAGLVECQPHPVHGRIQQLDLTGVGREKLARCKQRVQVIEKQLSASLSADEEAAVRRWLVAAARMAG
jgi:DNA-binding MarR family transcriptional regulator